MYLGLNTFIYEIAGVPVAEALQRASKFGFRFIEYPAYHSSDPTLMSKDKRDEVITIFKDKGLECSQLLLLHSQHIASPDPEKRKETLEYMKRCADFQLRLGGKQVLICRGCGIYEPTIMREQTWVNMVASLREYAQWCLDKGISIVLELEPHVYFAVKSTATMAKAIEDIGMPNVLANVDIGHLCIVREGPNTLEKLKSRIVHVHISETDAFEHTNSIIGTGVADFRAYIDKVLELGIEENCERYGEACVAGIEMGSRGGFVDDADRWVRESLDYLAKILPELSM